MGRRSRASLKDGSVFFVTTTIVGRTRVFCDVCFCEVLIGSIQKCRSRYPFDILAYVIMPSHFHWIVSLDPVKSRISDIMREIKKDSAFKLLDMLEETVGGLPDVFTLNPRRGQSRQFWQARFDDLAVTNDLTCRAKAEYIHSNPVRAGLVKTPEEYWYSSALDYEGRTHGPLAVNVDWW